MPSNPWPPAHPPWWIVLNRKGMILVGGDSFSKMDSTLESLVKHVERKDTLPQDVAQHVTDRKVLLQVWLTDTNPETLEKLKTLSFEVVAQPKTGRLMIGRLSVGKLEASSKLSVVRYLTLQRAAA